MKMKKVLAAAAASVLAVSAMSVAASAATVTCDFVDNDYVFNEGAFIKFQVSDFEDIDYLDIAAVNVVLTATDPEGWFGGAVAFASDVFDWGANQKAYANDGTQAITVASGEAFNVSYGTCPFDGEESYAVIAVQSWADDNEVKLDYIEFLDASGNVLKTYGAKPDAAPPADETPSDETPSETPDDTSKPNTNTGVEGVAAVVGVAVVAAGAMVVAKKRK